MCCMASAPQVRALLDPVSRTQFDTEMAAARMEEHPGVIERWYDRALDAQYAALAAAETDEDRAYHTAMRRRRRDRGV